MQKTYLKGFTLAEVLVTLGIIGIVAAMTIPTLVANYQQKSWNTSTSVFNRKLAEALKVMNYEMTLKGYTKTEDFVKELSKHIKIIKVCDNSELTNCFSDSIKTTSKTIDTNKLKTSKNLNKNKDYNTDTVGILFANGVSALLAYNPNCTQDPYNNQFVKMTKDDNNIIGFNTDAFSLLYDVSGLKSPNTYTETMDMRGININLNTCTGIEFDGKCAINYSTNFSPVNCSSSARNTPDYVYCSEYPSGYASDYWAGANKVCTENGYRLPTNSYELLDVWEAGQGLPETPTSGRYWAGTYKNGKNTYANYLWFDDGSMDGTQKNQTIGVFCIED